jgi:hypothetical protein
VQDGHRGRSNGALVEAIRAGLDFQQSDRQRTILGFGQIGDDVV